MMVQLIDWSKKGVTTQLRETEPALYLLTVMDTH